ncbi:MAG: hypothetical protein HOQ24_08930 [Mycobacteriaceae bacterium]|nr:hypothetical protein [Mycobacteriaceae bacterium]
MNYEQELAMRADFARYELLRERAAHGGSHFERELLIEQADRLADGWQTEEFAESWKYLVDAYRRCRERHGPTSLNTRSLLQALALSGDAAA